MGELLAAFVHFNVKGFGELVRRGSHSKDCTVELILATVLYLVHADTGGIWRIGDGNAR